MRRLPQNLRRHPDLVRDQPCRVAACPCQTLTALTPTPGEGTQISREKRRFQAESPASRRVPGDCARHNSGHEGCLSPSFHSRPRDKTKCDPVCQHRPGSSSQGARPAASPQTAGRRFESCRECHSICGCYARAARQMRSSRRMTDTQAGEPDVEAAGGAFVERCGEVEVRAFRLHDSEPGIVGVAWTSEGLE